MFVIRRHSALFALVAAGLLWGLTVPLSKLALEWLDGGWLTVVRFALAAPPLALVARARLRAAVTPRIVFAGAVGYGLVIVLQNAGIESTSVSHAALIVGAVPALVALFAALSGRGRTGPAAWLGFALALAGVGIVAGGGGGGASLRGDALVLASVALSATFVVVQPSLLRGRDPMAVTAVQMVAGALAAVPHAALEGLPGAPAGIGPVAALAALALAGTLAPFALFAYGQSRVAPELAGTFLNLEPLVGTAAGALAFGDPFGALQLAGGAVILTGIALSTTPPRAARRTRGRLAPTWGRSRHAARLRPCSTPASTSSSSFAPVASDPDGAVCRTYGRRAPPSRRKAAGGRVSYQAAPFSLSLPMTLITPRPDRSVTPHTYAVPVVRELPSSHPAAGVSSSSAW